MTEALPGSCSRLWDDPALPAWGTAAQATFVVALEQPGPWGAKALTQSGLRPEVGAALEQACAAVGGRALLVRKPAVPHPDLPIHGPRVVLLAGGFAGEPWLVRQEVADAAELLRLPLGSLAGFTPAEAASVLGWAPADPALLVCTNGRRDLCCALTGRTLANRVAVTHPGQVWETSHLGGHRFAPTALVLPSGVALGRLTPALARDALDAAASGTLAASNLDERHFRGRSCLAPAEQVADAAVRLLTGELSPGALHVVAAEAGADVRHTDGRRWEVAASRERLALDLPVSCGQAGEPTVVWRATALESLDAN